jgi:hypothetical protein
MNKNYDQHTLSERSSIEDSGYSMDKENRYAVESR